MDKQLYGNTVKVVNINLGNDLTFISLLIGLLFCLAVQI